MPGRHRCRLASERSGRPSGFAAAWLETGASNRLSSGVPTVASPLAEPRGGLRAHHRDRPRTRGHTPQRYSTAASALSASSVSWLAGGSGSGCCASLPTSRLACGPSSRPPGWVRCWPSSLSLSARRSWGYVRLFRRDIPKQRRRTGRSSSSTPTPSPKPRTRRTRPASATRRSTRSPSTGEAVRLLLVRRGRVPRGHLQP